MTFSTIKKTVPSSNDAILPIKPHKTDKFSKLFHTIRILAKITLTSLGVALGSLTTGVVGFSVLGAVPVIIPIALVGGLAGGIFAYSTINLAKKIQSLFVRQKVSVENKIESIPKDSLKLAGEEELAKKDHLQKSALIGRKLVRMRPFKRITINNELANQLIAEAKKKYLNKAHASEKNPQRILNDYIGLLDFILLTIDNLNLRVELLKNDKKTILAKAKKTKVNGLLSQSVKKSEFFILRNQYLLKKSEILRLKRILSLKEVGKSNLRSDVINFLIENDLGPIIFSAGLGNSRKNPDVLLNQLFTIINDLSLNKEEKASLEKVVFQEFVLHKLTLAQIFSRNIKELDGDRPSVMKEIRKNIQKCNPSIENSQWEEEAQAIYIEQTLTHFIHQFKESRVDPRQKGRLSYQAIVEKSLTAFDNNLTWEKIEQEAFNSYMNAQFSISHKGIMKYKDLALEKLPSIVIIDFPKLSLTTVETFRQLRKKYFKENFDQSPADIEVEKFKIASLDKLVTLKKEESSSYFHSIYNKILN